MKNKKGFTLVELLVVIALIGLLIAIAVPSGLTISKKIKQKMLDTKIETIESGAIVYGQNNKTQITSSTETCNIDGASYKCIKKDIQSLLNENALEEDDTKDINGDETEEKILINPVTNEELNTCTVYIYIKNKRVYAKYIKDNVGTTKCYY